MSRLATATIHMGALRANLARAQADAARVMAVIKADAYGHGLERTARALADADAFGVAAIADGRRLRAAGHAQRIVVLAGPDGPADLAEMRHLHLDAVIHHRRQLDWLAANPGEPLRVWLKLDTGMHRLGFPAAEAGALLARLRAMPGVHEDIVLMSHFASSEVFDGNETPAQIRAFEQATAGLGCARSLCNSAGLLGWPDAHADWVRIGGLLYGLSVGAGRCGADDGYRPAMTLSTRLVAVNRVAAGEAVGYGGHWRTPEAMPLGVAAIGYGDGYPRAARSGTPVRVNGQLARVAGRVSMDLLILDLRDAPDARVGDPVTLWGPDLPAETVAEHAGTIAYDLVCGLTRRVLYVEDEG